MAAEHRNDFLTNVQHFAPGAGSDIIDAFEILNDDEQNAVEKNLMHLYSRTWPETVLWNHIEKHGLRVDRN